MKVLASFKMKRLPPTLGTSPRNQAIDWESLPVEVVDSEVPWDFCDGPRRAGLSAFGLSGTNAHIILEEPTAVAKAGVGSVSRLCLAALVVFTGDAGLTHQARHWFGIDGRPVTWRTQWLPCANGEYALSPCAPIGGLRFRY